MSDEPQVRPFEELSESGLLWLINRVVFHPRGYQFALLEDQDTGEILGWQVHGTGEEPSWFSPESDQKRFLLAEATLREAKR